MICHLVLAHHSPAHLERLLSALTEDGDVAVVHLDARVDPTLFAAALALPGVVPVPDPVPVFWGGWSMVEATLRVLRTGIAVAPHATHFQVMSGDAYPLRGPAAMRAFYEGAGSTNFLDLDPFPNPHKPRYRITHYYVEHDPFGDRLALGYRIANRVVRRPTRGLGGRTPFTGSQWWTLTAAAAQWLLATTDSDPALVRFMRHTRVPDEHYVQTVLGNSILRDTLVPAVFYADWRPVPNGRRPPVLTAGHLDEMMASGAMWARKFEDDGGALVAAVRERWPRPGVEPTPSTDAREADEARS